MVLTSYMAASTCSSYVPHNIYIILPIKFMTYLLTWLCSTCEAAASRICASVRGFSAERTILCHEAITRQLCAVRPAEDRIVGGADDGDDYDDEDEDGWFFLASFTLGKH